MRHINDPISKDLDISPGGPQITPEQPEESRFAGTVGADQPDKLTLFNAKAELGDKRLSSHRIGDTTGLDSFFRHFFSWTPSTGRGAHRRPP